MSNVWKSRKGATNIWVESLEERRLMSVSLAAPVLGKHGHLAVSGTAHNDQIDISRSGSTLRVSVNGHVSKFSNAAIADITVLSSGGTDHVSVDPHEVTQDVIIQKLPAASRRQ